MTSRRVRDRSTLTRWWPVALTTVLLVLAPEGTRAGRDGATVWVSAEIDALPALSLTLCDDPGCGEATAPAAPQSDAGPAIVVEADGPWLGLLCAAVACGLETEPWTAGQAGRTIHKPTRAAATPAPALEDVGAPATLTVVVMR